MVGLPGSGFGLPCASTAAWLPVLVIPQLLNWVRAKCFDSIMLLAVSLEQLPNKWSQSLSDIQAHRQVPVLRITVALDPPHRSTARPLFVGEVVAAHLIGWTIAAFNRDHSSDAICLRVSRLAY